MLFIRGFKVLGVTDSLLDLELEVACKNEFRLSFIESSDFNRLRKYRLSIDVEYIGDFHLRKQTEEFYEENRVSCTPVQETQSANKLVIDERFEITISDSTL